MKPLGSLVVALVTLAACAHSNGPKIEKQASLLCERLVVDAQVSAENPSVTDSTFVAACVDAIAPKIAPCIDLPRASDAAQKCFDKRAGTLMNELYKGLAGKLEGTLLGTALQLELRTSDERRTRCKDATGLLKEACAIANRAVGRPHFEAVGALQFVGSLDATVVRRTLEGHVVDLRPCARLRPVRGHLALQITIDRNGEVLDTLVRDSTLGDGKVESCLAATVKKWTFDKPQNGGVEVVTWPLATRP